MIPFNIPLVTGKEIRYLSKVLKNKKFSGEGFFAKKCNEWLEKTARVKRALLTSSCTQALEMSAILIDIKNGDEVIMPSYTFPSTANAFVLRGAKVVFVDIRPDTMNLDEKKIKDAITKKTKAIVVMHYAGVGCEMDTIMRTANSYNLFVIEDAAQGIMASYKKRLLGSIGHIGCLSFHETKNFHCGEGGAILLNDKRFIERAEVIREKGTNRRKFLRGEIDKYTWVDVGSSYLISELNAAFLYSHFNLADKTLNKRLKLWERYFKDLIPLEENNLLDLPLIPLECKHNAHIFYIKLKNIEERQMMLNYLRKNGIQAAHHYLPLHLSYAGKKYGVLKGTDKYTSEESDRLLRLPLYYSLSFRNIDFVCNTIKDFFYD